MILDIQNIIKQVHIRTYYIAEKKKKEDPSIAFIQTSTDNDDILSVYINIALNDLEGKMIKRLNHLIFDIEAGVIEIKSNQKKADSIIAILEKAITNYVIEFVIFSWLKDVANELANPMIYLEKMNLIDKYISMLSPTPRRRSTDLAGI